VTDAAAIGWPGSRAAEGIELLARAARLAVRPGRISPNAVTGGDLERHVPVAAAALGLDAEPVDASCGELDALLRSAGPAVLRVATPSPGNGGEGGALLMLVGRRGRRVRVVAPDQRVVTVPVDLLRRALAGPEEAPLVAQVERLVDDAGVQHRRRAAVVRALVADRLRTRRLQAGWLLRMPPGSSFRRQLAAAGGYRQLALLAAVHAAHYGLWIAAWWLLGRAALQGRLDAAWLGAWVLALFSLIPLQLAALWLQGRLAISAGALVKQRLLAGAFRLEPEEIRTEGAGHLLGRVIEAQAVESLALGGGFLALLSALELTMAAGVLAASTPVLALLLLVWIGLAAALAAVFFGRRLAWVRLRIGLTLDLIEGMVGHRTRIAQQAREAWHAGEDEALERYVHASAAMDRASVWLLAVVPRGWVLVGLCGLAPLFVTGGSPALLAVGLGGILLAFKALDRLTNGLWSLAGAAIAGRQIAPVFRAAERQAADGAPAPASPPAPATLDATDLRFTHARRGEPVLQGCSVTVAPGDRIVLQGPSGGGKSTLASLLAGLRTPQSGLLLLDGADRHTLGLNGWRRRVVLVPQFHENHLVLGSVALNVLMGVGWPPAAEDFERAERVLRELGLGDTLDRMPSGLLQTIGETGWQLSHGERSRIFLARALLQQPDVLILDESFAQLDAENMQRALNAVSARAPAVLLIAHP
jgi:ATP-binding cassette subfamily B protein